MSENEQPYRIVVKVGTSTLTHTTGKLNLLRIERLVKVLSDLRNSGKQVVLVSSGAVGVGMARLGMDSRPDKTREKQAVAAVGQCALMHIYDKLFREYGNTVAQILLTRDVVEDEHRKENVVNTFETLFEYGVIPIVNENDTISTFELENLTSFGENDTLAAVVSTICRADLLIMLSDIDGLYDGDPKSNPDAKIIPRVCGITPELRALAGGAGSQLGTGGMATKLAAAEILFPEGISMAIINGGNPEYIYDLCAGKDRGTLFVPCPREDISDARRCD